MRFISWKRVKSWKCIACGERCRYFNIPLRGIEYTRLSKSYGSEVFDIIEKPGKIFLKRNSDGRCVFQYPFLGNWLCGIQNDKPIVCKLFPFLITKSNKKRALFIYRGKSYNVYLNRACTQIKFGRPSIEFANKTIPEAIEISLMHTRRNYFLYMTYNPLKFQQKLIQ